MGHEGMRASLVSREVIADSVELVTHAERFDGSVDDRRLRQGLPGMLMAHGEAQPAGRVPLRRHDHARPFRGRDVTIQDVFEAVGAAAGKMTDAELTEMERHACPGAGSCGGMFTANTMATAAEALGMALPGAPRPRPMARERDDCAARRRGRRQPRRAGITPRNIMTAGVRERDRHRRRLRRLHQRVLHLLAIATRRGRAHDGRLRPRRPRARRIIADLKPSGQYVMADMHRGGGIPIVLKELLDAGLLDGDALTVTGRRWAEPRGR